MIDFVKAVKRVLLLLDNAYDGSQVRPLLLPDPSAVIVTSRANFSLTEFGLYPLRLNVLNVEEARDLLKKSAPRLKSVPDEAIDALAKACGYLPLALKIAAGIFQERIDWNIETLNRKLTDEHTRLENLKQSPGDPDLDVEASLSLSYTLLADEMKRRLRLLGIFPAPFDLPALSAVWDEPLETCDAAIGQLLRLSLVDASPQELFPYRLHDLTRLYAESILLKENSQLDEAIQRHANHYLKQGSQAEDLYNDGHEHILEGLRLFDALWPHLQAAYERSLSNAGEPLADRWLNDFPGKVVDLLDLRLSPHQRIPLLESALAAARRLNNQYYEGIHLGNLGLAYTDLGEPRRAIEYHELLLNIAREIGDKYFEGMVLGNLGLAYTNLGEPHRTIDVCEQALTISREIGDKSGESNALGNLGLAYADLGEPYRAIEYYEQALVIDHEIGDQRGEGVDLGNLGSAYKNLGEPRRAIEFYEQALIIDREIGDKYGKGQDICNLGLAYADLGEPYRAMEYYEQALVIAHEIGDKQGEANACWNMGELIEKQGEFQRAAELMQVRVDYLRAIGHPGADEAAKQVEEVRKKAEGQGVEKRE